MIAKDFSICRQVCVSQYLLHAVHLYLPIEQYGRMRLGHDGQFVEIDVLPDWIRLLPRLTLSRRQGFHVFQQLLTPVQFYRHARMSECQSWSYGYSLSTWYMAMELVRVNSSGWLIQYSKYNIVDILAEGQSQWLTEISIGFSWLWHVTVTCCHTQSLMSRLVISFALHSD